MKRATHNISFGLVVQAMQNLAMRQPELLVGYYLDVLAEVNRLRELEGLAPITKSGLRHYIPEVRSGETPFYSTSRRGPLVLQVSDEILDELLARRITSEDLGNEHGHLPG